MGVQTNLGARTSAARPRSGLRVNPSYRPPENRGIMQTPIGGQAPIGAAHSTAPQPQLGTQVGGLLPNASMGAGQGGLSVMQPNTGVPEKASFRDPSAPFTGSFDGGSIGQLGDTPTNFDTDKNPIAYLPPALQQLLSEQGKFALQGLQGLDLTNQMTLPTAPGAVDPRATPEALNPATAGGLARAGDISNISRSGSPQDFTNTQLEQQMFQRGSQNVNQSYDEAVQRKMEELRQRGITNFATGSAAAELNRIEDERQEALTGLQTDISTQAMQDAFNNLFRSQQLDLGFGGLGLQGALGGGQLGLQGQGMMQGRESQLYGRDLAQNRQGFEDQLRLGTLENAMNQQRIGNVLGMANQALAPGMQAGQAAAANQMGAQQLAAQQAWRQAQLDQQNAAMQSQAQGGFLGSLGGLAGLGIGAALAAPTGGMSIPMGAALGGGVGGLGGSLLGGFF